MLPVDTVVEEVVAEFKARSAVGIAKYNTTLDRTDVDLVGWLEHLKQELMDAVLYVHRTQRQIRETKTVTVYDARDLLARERDTYKQIPAMPETFIAQNDPRYMLCADHGPAYVPSDKFMWGKL